MQTLNIKIDPDLLSNLLKTVSDKIPEILSKAYNSFLSTRHNAFFRASLISRGISIPVTSSVVCKEFTDTHRCSNIFVSTTTGETVEIQVYLNMHGIFAVSIAEDLENLLPESVNTENYILEKPPVSKFRSGYTDLEGALDEFKEVNNYLDSYYASETFTINSVKYFCIIDLSDRKCIVVDDKKKTYTLNKLSGQIKLIAQKPEQFVQWIRKNDSY